MKYFVSDTHFNHSNIIKLGHRPFNDVHEMNDALIENWNKKVRKNDEVYFLGDAGLGHGKEFSKLLRKQLFALNGRIHFIVGNHDKETLKVAPDRFKSITHIKTTKLFIPSQKRSIKCVMCHYPMLEWDGYYKGGIHLFGHCHGNLSSKFWGKLTKRHDVGVDVNNFAPLSEEEILSILL